MRTRSIIIFLFFSITITACSQKKESQGKQHEEKELINEKQDDIQILTKHGFSLTGDSVNLAIGDDDIKKYFETAETISEKIVLEILRTYNNQYSVGGEMVDKGDTLSYYILGDGTAITIEYRRLIMHKERKIAFYRNTINLPPDKYNKVKSKINILCFDKSKFDFALWEEWKKDYPDIIVDNNAEYEAYKRWNEKLDANGICKAFTLMKSLDSKGDLNVSLSVDPNCNLFGLAIMNNQLFTLYMDGGGAMYLTSARNDNDELIYGCYKPECLLYFTNRLYTNEEILKLEEEAY